MGECGARDTREAGGGSAMADWTMRLGRRETRPRAAGRAARAVLPALLALIVAGEAGAGLLERRRMLTAEEHAPWRAVGRVNIASFDERGMCTGTLIAQDLVITAAHCVISGRTGAVYPPGNVTFVAGWRQGVAVAHSKAATIVIHPGYRRDAPVDLERIGSDLALIRLRREIPADLAPHFKVAPAAVARGALTMISYRRDRAHALTRQEGCDVEGARDAVLALGCDVTFGASGSPLFVEVGGETRLVAVVSAMSRGRTGPLAWAVRVDAAIGEVLARLD
jgi:protease YdgD